MRPICIATGNPHKVHELRELFARELASVPAGSPLHGLEFIGLMDVLPPVPVPGVAPAASTPAAPSAPVPPPPPAHEPATRVGTATPGRFIEPLESGVTFEQNATIKALSYARQTGHICLADDSGLEIDALHGEPGVISSHYSTDGRETNPPMSRNERDARNNEMVLKKLEGIEPERRAARFVCVMALAAPSPAAADDPRLLHLVRGTFEGRIGLPPRVPAGAFGFGYDPLFLVGPAYTQTSAELPLEIKNRLSHRAAAARLMIMELARMAEGMTN